MLEFLQTGKALYVLAAVCGLGMISKLVTSSLYKRLIKETGNMALTKNKNLRSLKQRTESMFLLSHGIRNAGAYIEKQLYGFRFMKMSLDAWENFSVQAMILSFLLGGIAAFGAYWYRCDSYYIVLYGTMGVLSGLLLVLVDNGTNISLKRQQLTDALIDYVENSPHFYKAGGKVQDTADMDRRLTGTASEQKNRLRGIGRNSRGMAGSSAEIEMEERASETAGRESAGRESVGRETVGRESAGTDCEVAAAESAYGVVHIENAVTERNRLAGENNGGGKRRSLLSRKKGKKEPVIRGVCKDVKAEEEYGSRKDVAGNRMLEGQRMQAAAVDKNDGTLTQEEELAKSIDSLKQSLEQIAASREQARREFQIVKPSENEKLERARKELSAEDLKFLGELLQEYFK